MRRRYGFFRPRPHRAWHRWTRRLLELLLGVVAGLVILLGFAAWRLSEGPITLGFLTPRLEEAFAAGGTRVAIAQTLLVWDEERQSLDLRVRDLAILDEDGGPALTLPESNLTLAMGRLLRGEIVVTALQVLGADLRLTRLEDGSFLGLGGAAAPGAEGAPGTDGATLGLIDALLAEEDEANPLASLAGIGLIDSRVVFDDRLTGRVWTLPAERIDLRRDPRGLSGEADLAVELDGETAYLQVVFAYSKRRGLLDLSANVQQLATAKLAAALPALGALALLDTRVDGQVNVTLAREADLGLVDFEFGFGAGRLWLGDGANGWLPLAGGSFAGLYDIAAGKLELDRLQLQTGSAAAPGPQVTVQGTLQRDASGDRLADLTIALDRVAADQLGTYWPAGASPGGRAWAVESISGGWVRDARVEAGLRIAVGEGRPEVRLERLAGGFALEGLTVAWLPPLPPATEVQATATVALDRLDFQISSARIGTLAFTPITVAVYGLDGEDHRLRVAAQGEGPLPELLALLDHPRLDLIEGLGLRPEGAEGGATLSLSLDFSLLGEVTFADIDFDAGATFEEVRLPGLVAGQDLAARRLVLAVDNSRLQVEGQVRLGDSRFDATWIEPIGGGERRITAKSDSVPASTLVSLVPALAGRLTGSLALALDARLRGQGSGSVVVEAGLGPAGLDLPDLDWSKAAGEPATARFTARLEQGDVVALEGLAVEAPGLVLAGEVALGREGRLLRLALSRAEAFGQRLGAVVAEPLDGGGWRLAIDGGTLDARPWIEGLEGAAPAEERPDTPLLIEASRLDRVLLGNGSLDQVTLSGARDALGIERLALAGDLVAAGSPGGRVSLTLAPDAEGRRALLLQASDMGAVLRALDIVDTVIGGTLEIQLRAAGAERGSRMTGSVEGRTYRLVKAPTLAKILMGATLIGLGDALDSEGIPFQRLTGEIAYQDGVLSTPLLRAYGGSLGITAEGTLDFGRDVIDLEGTVVPAYAINDVLGDIPILGWIITGGEGGGLLAVSYSVSGAVSDPQVSVNPLSALTPGFLRGLFDLFEGDGSPPPATLYPEGPGR